MQAYFTLNNFCNQKCITCPTGSNEKDLSQISFDVLKERVNECRKAKIDSIVLSGGEPFAYPFIFECIKYIHKQKINITVLTNGALLDEKIIKKLIKYKNHLNIVIAIHSDIASEHDFVTSKIGSFDLVMKNISLLDKYNFHLCFKIILNKISALKLKEISCMLQYKLKNSFQINVCSMDMCNISKKYKNIFLTGKEIEYFLDLYCEWYDKKRNKNFHFYISEFPICLMTKNSIKFLHFRKENPNVAFIPRHSNKIIYNSKYDCFPCFDYCKNCFLSSLCPGIWTSNIKYFEKDCSIIDKKRNKDKND